MQKQEKSVRLVAISLIVVATTLMFNRTIYYGSTFFINLIFSIGMFLGPILILLKRTKQGVIVSFVFGFFAFMKSSYLAETYTIFSTIMESPLYAGPNPPSNLNINFSVFLSVCYMLLSSVGIFLAYPLIIDISEKKLSIHLFVIATILTAYGLGYDGIQSRWHLIFSVFMFIGPMIIFFYRVRLKLGVIFSFCVSLYFTYSALSLFAANIWFGTFWKNTFYRERYGMLFLSAWYMLLTVISLVKLNRELIEGGEVRRN